MSGLKPKIAVIMITQNEAHHLPEVFENLTGFADEVFVLDSFSADDTVKIALQNGARVHQRKFDGFGTQWNYAVQELPIQSPWVMKLDPDERLSEELKTSIKSEIEVGAAEGFMISRRLWFMGKPLPAKQNILRIWKAGTCRFTDVAVNEHPIVDGEVKSLKGNLEHHDSPNLHHWVAKQNQYSSVEAESKFKGEKFAFEPSLTGSKQERRMWFKKHFTKFPFRHLLVFLYCFIILGAWKVGRVGYIWSCLRADIYRMREYKLLEMQLTTKPKQQQHSKLKHAMEKWA